MQLFSWFVLFILNHFSIDTFFPYQHMLFLGFLGFKSNTNSAFTYDLYVFCLNPAIIVFPWETHSTYHAARFLSFFFVVLIASTLLILNYKLAYKHSLTFLTPTRLQSSIVSISIFLKFVNCLLYKNPMFVWILFIAILFHIVFILVIYLFFLFFSLISYSSKIFA